MSKCGVLLFLILFLAFLVGCGEKDNKDYDAPTNLNVFKITDNKVKLTWDYPSTNDTTYTYTIARKVGEDDWDESYYVSTTGGKSYIDEITTNSTSVYAYKVKIYDKDTDTYTAFCEPAAYFSSATAPTDLQLIQPGQNKITVSWTDNCEGEEGYKIDRKSSSGSWVNGYAKVDANVTSYTDSVTFAVPLQYRVSAYFGGDESSSISGEINPSFPAPSGLVATQFSQQAIHLNWTCASTNQEGFSIERRIGLADTDNDFAEVATVTDTLGAYTDYISQDAATVYYRVRAYSHTTENGQSVLIHSAYSGIAAIDFNIGTLSEMTLTSNACDVAVSQNYAFVANEFAGTQFYEVSNEANPSLLGTLTSAGRVMSVEIQGSLLMVGHTNGGIDFYSLADITSPTLLSTCTDIDIPYDLQYASINNHPYLFVADGEAGLLVIDLDDNNPANPMVIKRINTPGISFGLTIEGTTLYLADGSNGVLTYDISTPSDPRFVRESAAIGEVHALALHNGNLYAAAGENGLVVLDAASLEVTQSKDTSGFAKGVAFAENRVYVTDGDDGLLIIDPSTLHIKADVATGSSANALVRLDNMAYVATAASFRIIQVNP